MPELPEIETTCRGIAPHIVEQTIQHVIVRQRQLRWPIQHNIKHLLSSQRITGVSRRAKYVLIATTQGYLIIHLGMSGTLRVVPANTPLKKHDHFDCQLSNGLILRYHDPRRFGAILWADDPQSLSQFQNLGPEPLDQDFNAGYLYQRAQKHTIPIKNLLMNNAVVVGVGNIYASESLYQAQISPLLPSKALSLPQAKALVVAVKQVLKQAIKQGGTTLKDFRQADGKPGYFRQQLQVYDREGEPCFRCAQTISRIKIAQRMTYYCQSCQPTSA